MASFTWLTAPTASTWASSTSPESWVLAASVRSAARVIRRAQRTRARAPTPCSRESLIRPFVDSAGSVWVATHLRGEPGLAPGEQVALKFDDVPEEGQADPAQLPLSADCRLPLSSLDSCVLREAHAYSALLDGCTAPPDAPVPAFAVPFICEVRIAHKLRPEAAVPGCTMAYERRFVYALALPRLGRSLFAVGRDHTPTPTQALKLGASVLTSRCRHVR